MRIEDVLSVAEKLKADRDALAKSMGQLDYSNPTEWEMRLVMGRACANINHLLIALDIERPEMHLHLVE